MLRWLLAGRHEDFPGEGNMNRSAMKKISRLAGPFLLSLAAIGASGAVAAVNFPVGTHL